MSRYRRPGVPVAVALALALLAPAALAADVPIGGEAILALRIENRSHLAAEKISFSAESSAPWLTVEAPSAAGDIPSGGEMTFGVKVKASAEAAWGDEARLVCRLSFAYTGETAREFRVEHVVAAVPAAEPGAAPGGTSAAPLVPDLHWILVEARGGSDRNRVLLTVKNTGKSAIRGFALRLSSSTPDLAPSAPVVISPEAAGEPGEKARQAPEIPAGGARSYSIGYSVRTSARPGSTAVLSVAGEAVSRMAPRRYEAAVLVSVDAAGTGGKGNFEGYLLYNLPPHPGARPGGEKDWKPVPKGTRLSVAQIYTLPGSGGQKKLVEQYVGYGNVLDDRGYFRVKVAPEGQSPYRLRLVAETMANEVTAVPKPGETGAVERYDIGRARAAVAPFGKTLYKVISYPFLADKEAASGMLRPRPGQEGTFVSGDRILLPYYGYARDLDEKNDPGILIEWEGELSTGGVINFFESGGLALTDAMDWGTGYSEQIEAAEIPGLIWHNRPELLHVLATIVRAQDALRGALPEAKEGEEKPEVPPAIAVWKPGLTLAPSETGYWLREDGLWRLSVSGDPEDPDEEDADLVLRGYGAAVRRAFLEGGAAGAEVLPPAQRRYRYDVPVDPERAFALGFDTYFAAAVLGRGRVENAHARDERLKTERTADLEGLLHELKAAEAAGGPEALLRADLARRRGLRSPLAVAAGLWLAHSRLGNSFLRDLLAAEPAGAEPRPGLARFLDVVATRAPELFPDLAVLGLAPRVTQVPDPALAAESLPPSAVILLFDGRGMAAEEQPEAWIALTGGGTARIPIALRDGLGAASPGDFAPPAKGGAAAPAVSYADGSRLSWRVYTRFGEGPPIPGPVGGFTVKAGGGTMGPEGGQLSFPDLGGGRGGRLTVPPGALPEGGRLEHTVLAQDGPLDGKKVLGGSVHRFSDARFGSPAKLGLSYDPAELPPGAPPPTIHRLDEASGKWQNLGGVETAPGYVETSVDHASVFALLSDPEPPSPGETGDGPDPFDPESGRPLVLRFSLPSAAEVTAEVTDDLGRPVARLCDRTEMEAGTHTLEWSGRDSAGAAVPDGTYGYVVRARDGAGREGEPGAGRVTVFRGLTGEVRGRAAATGRRTDAAVRIRSAAGSSAALAGPDGAYVLPALAPGRQVVVFSARGHFPEEREVEVPEGGEAALADVALTDQALASLEADPPVIYPGAAPADPPLPERTSLRLAFDRPCDARVVVVDRRGRVVRTLHDGPVAAGALGLSFDGEDDRGRPRSGVHFVRVIATAGGEEVPQGEARILVDRGLVRYGRALPRIFSPDDDGFEDVTRLALNLSDEAVVTASVLDAAGLPVRVLLDGTTLPEGWHELPWDGTDAAGQRLPEGPYGLLVTSAYTTGEASLPVRGTVVLDSAPPRFLEITPVNGAVEAGGRPTIRARLEPCADLDLDTLRVKIDEMPVRPDAYDPATGWLSYTPKTSLGDGVHIALVYARDLAENMAAPEATSFRIQAAAPEKERPRASFVLPGDGATAYSARPSVEVLLADDGSGIDPESIRLSFDGEEVPNRVRKFIPGRSGKSWDKWQYDVAVILFDPLEGRVRYNPVAALAPGRHVVRLEATDRRGNRLPPAEQTFAVVLDETPPRVDIESPREGERLFTTAFTLAARLRDEGGSGLDLASVEVRVDGEPRAGVPAPEGDLLRLPLDLADGTEHTVSVSVRDRAGNRAAGAVMFTVAADRTPPGFALTWPEAGRPLPPAPFLVRGRVFDDGAGLDPASVTVLVDGRAVPGATCEDGLLAAPVPPLPPGGHEVTVLAADRAGNPGRLDLAVTIRATVMGPRVAFSAPPAAPAAGEPVLVEASLEAGPSGLDAASIVIRLDGRIVPLPPGAFDAGSGRLRFYLPEAAERGVQRVLTIDARDRDGNGGTAAREFVGR